MTNEQQRSPIFRLYKLKKHLYNTIWGIKQLLTDGLLGPGDYGLLEDWSDINRSRDGYIRIRDGLILVGEIQEMNNEENFYDDGPYQARVYGFFLAYHQVVAYHW